MKLKFLLATGVLALPMLGQVPGIITYQGRVTSGGLNFNGNGLFKFALVSPPSPDVTSFWSNDGTSVAGSEPTAAVSVSVVDGLFTVLLGDASLANMQVIPAAVFAAPDVRLRVWFNDGVNGFAGLTPDQRLTSSGYALRAAGTPDNSITQSMLAGDSVGSAQVIDGSLGTTDLANAAINAAKLAPAAVTTEKLAPASVTADKLAPGAVTAGSIANNSLGSAQIADTLALRELTLETAAGLNRIELSGTGDSGILRMNHGSIGRFLEVQGTTSGGLLKLFDKLGGELAGQTTVELGSASTGGYLRAYQDNGSAGVHINGQNGVAPGGTILIYRSAGLGVVVQGQDSNGGGQIAIHNAAGARTVELVGTEANNPGGQIVLRREDGAAGIVLDGQFGSGGGEISIRNRAGAETVQILGDEGAANLGGQVVIKQGTGKSGILLDGQLGSAGGLVQVFKADGTVAISLDAQNASNEGQVTTQVLQITGGSDLSERFDLSEGAVAEPGMIVCIDPDQPGRLLPSARAYDRTVAGVISGAGGVRPGMLMGQRGSVADGQQAVALSGRVYCLVDAGPGAVHPGDLITTSDTPGHGMRVTDHDRAQGAVLGKAMTRLDRGRGLVLVLVALQ